MSKFDSALVVTHVIYRKNPPFDKLEGPYSSVERALSEIIKSVEICQIPIADFNKPAVYGNLNKHKHLNVPRFFGRIIPLKYVIDIFVIAFVSIRFILSGKQKEKIIIGIDPLSCLPLTLLRKIFNFKLVFYSVDFNLNRFTNKLLQKIYEKADEISTRHSDQAWVVCESLLDYKKKKHQVESIYIPNSSKFNEKLYSENKHLKTGNKIAWTGTLLTEKQFDILFGVLKGIQKIKDDAEFYFAPINNHKKFEEYSKKYQIKHSTVLNLHSRSEWQQFAAKCDIGIAIYDDEFGSTEFIEPLKIWDFLTCGMPFIISGEPSVSAPIQESGVVFRLDSGNKLPNDNSLEKFLSKDNIEKLKPLCVGLAKEFDIQKQISKALAIIQ